MVVFGGNIGTVRRNDTWVLDLAAPTPEWILLAPPLAPIGRDSHIAVYDGANRQMIIHGGHATSRDLSDAMALSLDDPPTWTFLPASPVLAGHVAVADSARDRMLVFGGGAGTSGQNTWAYSFSNRTWTVLPTGGDVPNLTLYPGAAFNPERVELAVFGGSPTWYTWRLPVESAAPWVLDPFASPPPATEGQLGVLDTRRRRIVLFGTRGPDDLWEFSLDQKEWAPMNAVGPGPAARDGSVGIYDPVEDRILLHGGRDGTGALSDLWELRFGATPTWQSLSPANPIQPRCNGAAIYDPVRRRMVVDGGARLNLQICFNFPYWNKNYAQDAWALNLDGTPDWTRLAYTGGYEGHTMVYDAARDRYDRLGGERESNSCGGGHDPLHTTFNAQDVFAEIDPGTETATLIPHSPGPLPRSDMRAVIDQAGDRLFLFGGAAQYSFHGAELWQWDLASRVFRQLDPDGPKPAARGRAVFVFDEVSHSAWLFGGGDGYVWQLRPADNPTPILASVEDFRFEGGSVHVRWRVDPTRANAARPQRRTLYGAWEDLDAPLAIDGSIVDLSDGSVEPGERYGYRLAWLQGKATFSAAEVWLDIPGEAQFGLELAAGQAAPGGMRVRVRIDPLVPARLDLISVQGRVVRSIPVGARGGADQVIDLAAGDPPAHGMYWARLRNGTRSRVLRLLYLH
jgi:hypothetical protein